mmetsp:Transcript_57034/g.178653  ORF Transcript_57034/g.178653 Transcript_57034/m.178653 type:complete len:262 (+) Transcript_57034:509-1294(+)
MPRDMALLLLGAAPIAVRMAAAPMPPGGMGQGIRRSGGGPDGTCSSVLLRFAQGSSAPPDLPLSRPHLSSLFRSQSWPPRSSSADVRLWPESPQALLLSRLCLSEPRSWPQLDFWSSHAEPLSHFFWSQSRSASRLFLLLCRSSSPPQPRFLLSQLLFWSQSLSPESWPWSQPPLLFFQSLSSSQEDFLSQSLLSPQEDDAFESFQDWPSSRSALASQLLLDCQSSLPPHDLESLDSSFQLFSSQLCFWSPHLPLSFLSPS